MFITVQGVTDFVIIIPDCPKPDLKWNIVKKKEVTHDPMKPLTHCEQTLQVRRSVQNEFPWFSCRCRSEFFFFFFFLRIRRSVSESTLLSTCGRYLQPQNPQRWYFACWARWRTATVPYTECACQCHVLWWWRDWTWGTRSMDPISPALTPLDSSL